MRELREWAAFESLEGPIAIGERIDHSGATISAILANLLTSEEHKYTTADFLPRWDPEAILPESEPQDPDAIMAAFVSMRDLGRRRKKKRGS